jgi:hypothetical protein
MMRMISYPVRSVVLGVVRPGMLRWIGVAIPRMTDGWRGLRREMGAFKIRWALVLVLALAFVILLGELSPAASAIFTSP